MIPTKLFTLGSEYYGYSSDITRTWPVSGKFSKEQRELYEVVLYTQKEVIKLCAEMPPLDLLFDEMCHILGKQLQELGLISKFSNGEALRRVSKTKPTCCT